MNRLFLKLFVISIVLFFQLVGPLSADVKISSLPQPPPTAKLRVFVLVLTHETKTSKGSTHWHVSPEKMKQISLQAVGNILKAQGIYEIVSQADVACAIGDQSIASWEWTAKDYTLAHDVGRALHVDYVFILERSYRIHLQMDMNLINMSTGKRFTVSNYVSDSFLKSLNSNDQRMLAGGEAIKISYRRLFTDAKSDLLQTALSKGKISAGKTPASLPNGLPPEETKKPALEPLLGIPPAVTVFPAAVRTENKTTNDQAVFEKELSEKMTIKEKPSTGLRLVVYDFDATDRLKIVGLILTEALREELHHSGGFLLVNRENILKIMDEYKMQQSGAVDENSVVKVGKWLAASEAITGTLAVLGSTSILQVKRIDIQTLGTISLGSLKCPSGKEDELLEQMPQLARKLTRFK